MNREEWEKEDYSRNIRNLPETDTGKERFKRTMQAELDQPVDSPLKAKYAEIMLRLITDYCDEFGWNVIEILGGDPNAGKNNVKVENLRHAPVHV